MTMKEVLCNGMIMDMSNEICLNHRNVGGDIVSRNLVIILEEDSPAGQPLLRCIFFVHRTTSVRTVEGLLCTELYTLSNL